jgi:hypothetical protein
METRESLEQENCSGEAQSVEDQSAVSARSFDDLSSGQDPGIISELIQFLRYNKKWWLTPILIVTLLLIGAAILLPSPVAPFIYTLF